ncbi:MAG: phenylalanine--tRNA ligase subunit alpha [Methanomassiliicoccales archaeon]
MSTSQILAELSNQEKKVLLALEKLGGAASPEKLLETGSFSQLVEVMNGANWLQLKGLVEVKESPLKVYAIKNKEAAKRPLPERKALLAISAAGGSVKITDLEASIGRAETQIAIGWLRRKGLANLEKVGNESVITLTDEGRKALNEKMEDEKVLEDLAKKDMPEGQLSTKIINMLKSRQDLIIEKSMVSRQILLTPQGKEVLAVGIELKEEVAQLTPELIQTGKWREVSFRRYDVNAFAPISHPAKKHPLTRIADEIRRIFLQMGFEEIDEEYVQPAFWDMDALFTPQDHPARDMQDTFYLKNPARIPLDQEAELVEKVRKVHEHGGGTGSLGWRYKWSKEEAERALLRTHTTVNTIRYLAKHPNPPVKVFSLSRVFRKEAIDSTHLPEFVQIEGIVMEKNGSFDMLVGILKEFYKRMGFEQIRVRPGYFPYTEPSLEVEVMWNGKWMELGGAGIFRPEVTAPFGVKYPVLAWGQGFERLAMLRWNLKDIRDLYITDIEMLRESPIF